MQPCCENGKKTVFKIHLGSQRQILTLGVFAAQPLKKIEKDEPNMNVCLMNKLNE